MIYKTYIFIKCKTIVKTHNEDLSLFGGIFLKLFFKFLKVYMIFRSFVSKLSFA